VASVPAIDQRKFIDLTFTMESKGMERIDGLDILRTLGFEIAFRFSNLFS
jgi:hypothetical protein